MPANKPIWDDAHAQDYIARHSQHPMARAWVKYAELAADDVVLDIGCGDGTALEVALPRLTTGHAIGIDPTALMIARARDRFRDRAGVDVQQAAAERIPVATGAVSLVLANCAATHFADIRLGLREIYRVLRDGGRLLCIEEDFGGPATGNLPPDQDMLTSAAQLPELMTRMGFVRMTTQHVREMGTPFTVIRRAIKKITP